ncbi:MAG: exostosin family protein [Armatimonas sp.]
MRDVAGFSKAGHVAVDSPEAADFLLAASCHNSFGLFFDNLKRSKLFSKYKDRVYAYSYDDNVFPALPGIYSAASPYYCSLGWATAAPYISDTIFDFEFPQVPMKDRDLLYSFLGTSATHPLRDTVLSLKHPDGHCADMSINSVSIDERRKVYKAIMARTKFALCPRGVSPSSVRLFEVMEAGCVPVILSDELILPEGPNWDEIIVKIPESDVLQVPELLQGYVEQAESRGLKSRQAWEQYFSPNALFDWSVNAITNLPVFNSPEKLASVRKIAEREAVMDPSNIRKRLGYMKSNLKKTMRSYLAPR